MTKKLGRTMLISISDGAAGFDAFAGMTAKTLKVNNERIDATTPDPTTPEGEMWRETLAGTKSVDVSGDITLVEDAAEARVFAAAMSAEAVDTFRILIPGVGTFEGEFSVECDFSGDGAISGSLSLASTGPTTFTAA